MEIDPKKRIEWDDFFNHKVFALHEQKKKVVDPSMEFNLRQSVMFRNNEDIVK